MRSVSQWAQNTFGDVAGNLVDIIPACLARAHDRARNGQEGVHTQTLEAYGHGLHAVQYEELATGLAPYGDSLRLQGRTIMLVRNHLVYPIRYAKQNVPVTAARLRRARGFRADLIRRHGPEPMQQSFDLGLDELDDTELSPDLGLIPAGVRLVLIAYACSMERGVVRVEWGSAELRREDRFLIWHHHEALVDAGKTDS
ncbi:hypothetical protein C3486_10125 [Streptomyces sp. Ru73]|uniref:hypothetical protein n=1 Tax=Streptomyces sp. Ru73 TaxID=2080748 RepID=UPI000CDDE3CC|nr:hypothetical protein [Streptomyces sp. Ru73]POX41347.1 hypothetical protein C3486_10125 [Streptomyces sp. Ru73]